MKAVILKEYGSADNFESADIPVPPVRKGEIRIKIKAASFNPVDYQIRKGLPESKSVHSNILGRDLSGIVDEVDGEVKDFEKGDEVFCYVADLASSGTYTEFVSVPSEIVSKKPIVLSHEMAAAIPVAGITAWIALEKLRVDKKGSIFVAGGAGGVGTFAIMFLKQSGVERIITTAGNEKSLSYLIRRLQLKQEQIINYKKEGFISEAETRNGGKFDAALDLVGGKMLSACCELLGIDGDLASVTEAPGLSDFDLLFNKNASFHPVGANAWSLSDKREYWEKYKSILDRITRMFDNHELPEPPITIIGQLSPDTVRAAHQMLENGAAQGKLIMTC